MQMPVFAVKLSFAQAVAVGLTAVSAVRTASEVYADVTVQRNSLETDKLL